MKALDLEGGDEKFLKALVYGSPGTGKTTLGVTAPRPLILLCERQAVPHIRSAAVRLGLPLPMTILIESVQDLRNVLRALHGDKTKPFVVKDDDGKVVFETEAWPESVVIDSLTEACDLISKEIREQSPPKLGKDNLPVDSERYWNVYFDRATKLIRAYRDVPLNVFFLALLEDKEIGEGEQKERTVGPQMGMRRLPNVVASAVNVVGVTYRTRKLKSDQDAEIVYGVATVGPDYMLLKPYRPLRDHEVTDLSAWHRTIHGEAPKAAPPPMTEAEPAEPKKTDKKHKAETKSDAAATA